MYIIAINLVERPRKVSMSLGVFAGVVLRNSLYQCRKILATPISFSDSMTGAPR